MENNKNCLIDVLKLIDNIQKCSTRQDNEDSSCQRPILGLNTNISVFNTRPVTFFLCNNTQLSLTYYVDNQPFTSNTFRIENINDNCVTIRLLAPNVGSGFTSTNEFATININCICAIKCLNDISLNL